MHQKALQKAPQHKVLFGVLSIEVKPMSYAVPRIMLNEIHPKYQLHYIGELIDSVIMAQIKVPENA